MQMKTRMFLKPIFDIGRELRQNRAQAAIGLFTKALDLSTPSTRTSDRALCTLFPGQGP